MTAPKLINIDKAILRNVSALVHYFGEDNFYLSLPSLDSKASIERIFTATKKQYIEQDVICNYLGKGRIHTSGQQFLIEENYRYTTIEEAINETIKLLVECAYFKYEQSELAQKLHHSLTDRKDVGIGFVIAPRQPLKTATFQLLSDLQPSLPDRITTMTLHIAEKGWSDDKLIAKTEGGHQSITLYDEHLAIKQSGFHSKDQRINAIRP